MPIDTWHFLPRIESLAPGLESHAILSDDMGTVLIEQGQLLYDFHNADLIFDFLVSIGMRPFVELSFMPIALASGENTCSAIPTAIRSS